MQQRTVEQRSFEDRVHTLLAARYAIVFVQTYEESRLERALLRLATQAFSQPVPLFTWSVTEGLSGGADEETLQKSCDPVVALDAAIRHEQPALYLFRDLHRHYDDARVLRRLRDAHQALSSNFKTLFLCAPELDIPTELHKEVAVLELPPLTVAEIDQLFSEACQQHPNVVVDLGDKRETLLRAVLGLTEMEARGAFGKLLVGRNRLEPSAIEQLYAEKRDIVRKEGILDYVPHRVHLDDIGGLGTLKRWLTQRRRFFDRDAEQFGLDPPKGLLVTGISGCGKSMAVQAVATCWSMPLLRLDLNRIYAAVAGSPERTLERAIQTAEAISPCVLWIDEIETAIVGTHGSRDASLSTRIFSSLLTWMQEKDSMVFVAATANEIDKLPPELLRKGRFDEIFFVDLPNEQERFDILTVHLNKRNKDATAIDVSSLAKATTNFNGAELEQVVLSAMYAAFDEDREIGITDLYRSLGRMVPLATTMAERIKEIKRWASTRAVKASG